MKGVSLDDLNEAIGKLVPHSSTPGYGREFYGAKLKGIREQFSKFVPSMYVPGSQEVNPGGLTFGMFFPETQTYIGDYFTSSAGPSAQCC